MEKETKKRIPAARERQEFRDEDIWISPFVSAAFCYQQADGDPELAKQYYQFVKEPYIDLSDRNKIKCLRMLPGAPLADIEALYEFLTLGIRD